MAAAVLAGAAWATSRPTPWLEIVLCGCLGQALVLVGMLLHLQIAERRSRRMESAIARIDHAVSQLVRSGKRHESREPHRHERR